MSSQSPQPKPPQKSQTPIVNPSLRELNQSYATKIAKGQLSITPSPSKKKISAAEKYDRLMKQKKIAEAAKQKQQLERRLAYLNKSIETIKEYDFNTGRAGNDSKEMNASRSPEQVERYQRQARKRVKDYQKLNKVKKDIDEKHKQVLQESYLKIKKQEQQLAKVQRKQKILQNMQKIKKRVESREVMIKQQQQQYRKVVEQKTLFKRLEQDYSMKESSMLEQRKKKLADIRNLHRPISIAEIADHQKSFLDILKEKQSMRQRERRINSSAEEYKVSYRSPTHLKIAEEDRQIEGQNISRVKIDKMRQFSQHVRQNFVPVIDESKRESLEKVLEEERERKQRQLQKVDEQKERVEQTRNKGLRYLQQIRDLPKKKGNTSQQQPKTERVHYKNYLTHSQNSSNKNWRNILNGKQDKKSKAIRLQFQAQKFQNSLRLKQQKAKLFKGDHDEIDQDYFDMIKAKLDLLQIQ